MQISRKLKAGLIIFALFDVALIIFLTDLYQIRSERELSDQLRDLGVTIYPEPRPIKQFELIDQHRQVFTEADLKGSWNLMFFGFTACPDICPLTMAELSKFYTAMGGSSEREQLEVILVSVDPERDGPEEMANYLAKFNSDFIGLSGEASMIANLAEDLYVVHAKPGEPGSHQQHAQEPDDYLIQHSGHIAVINPQGDFHSVIRPPIRDEDLLEAYRLLIN